MGIQDAISRLGRERSVPPGFLRPIDTEAIATDLAIEEKGAEYGRQGLPTTDANVMDSVEQTVVQKVEGEWTWQSGELINLLRTYAARLVGFSIDTEFAKLKIQGNNALTQLRALNLRAPADLGPLQEDYIAARDELARFRKQHRLIRPARDPANRWTAFGLLTILVAIESVLNGFFFAKGAALGLIGGIGTALGISLVNVVLAFLVGLLPARGIRHRSWSIKLISVLVTVVATLALIAFHAFAAHLREATMILSGQGVAVKDAEAMTYALKTFLQTPWQVSELTSVYLFLLGTIFALLALWKGYRFDDPYPGYGAVTRRFKDAREAYSDEHAELFDGLEDVKEETITDIRAGLDRIPRFPQEAANIRIQRDAMIQTFRAYEKSIVNACNQLLARYRQSNKVARGSPPPTYFNEEYPAPRSVLDSSEVRLLLTEAPAAEADIPAMMAELHDLSRVILAEFEALLAIYPHPTNMS